MVVCVLAFFHDELLERILYFYTVATEIMLSISSIALRLQVLDFIPRNASNPRKIPPATTWHHLNADSWPLNGTIESVKYN